MSQNCKMIYFLVRNPYITSPISRVVMSRAKYELEAFFKRKPKKCLKTFLVCLFPCLFHCSTVYVVMMYLIPRKQSKTYVAY